MIARPIVRVGCIIIVQIKPIKNSLSSGTPHPPPETAVHRFREHDSQDSAGLTDRPSTINPTGKRDRYIKAQY